MQCSSKSYRHREKEQTTGEAKESKSKTIKHEMGETVLKNTPKKIVTLELSFVDS